MDITVNLIAYAVAFLIAVLITRAIFSIGTIVKNMKAQTTLLYLMARQQKVSEEAIQKIVTQCGIEYISATDSSQTTV